MTRRRWALALALALLAAFVVAGSWLRGRQPQTSLSDFQGDWQCQSLTLDIRIELEGSNLLLSGLDPAGPLRFSPQGEVYREAGGRTLKLRWRNLELLQPSQPPLLFQRREPQ